MSWRAPRVAFSEVAALQDALQVPEPVAWTLVRRGLGDPAEAREFLASDGPLAPAESLPGIAEAADRLARAVRGREPIAVHGDYDCDGICSTAVLVRALRGRGGLVRPFLPSRFAEGYGVAPESVDVLAREGARVLVCVDCGTSAVEALTRAADAGMEPIVLDHHLAGGRRPPGILANPALGRPVEDLPAAAGVVHMLVRALAARMDGDALAPDPEEGIDLVALATVADAVPLVGDNRRLVARGLRAMRERPRPAIAALCAAAGLEPRTLGARALGFTLAPCINAAGRLSHPDRALELLLAADGEAADPIAGELWLLNKERREVERAIVDEAVAQVEAEPDEIRAAKIILAAGDGWHEGVVGIVASRLAERFERPAIVLSRQGDRAKGSGRSLPGVDLHAIVAAADGTLTRWGGHPGAVGLELPASSIARFRDELIRAAEGSGAAIARARVRRVDAVVGGRDLGLAAAEAMEALAPFGRGNPPVRLVVPGVELASPVRVGEGRHLQVRLRSDGVHARGIGFRMGERAAGLDLDERHDAVISLEIERWQGLVSPRVSLEAIEPLTPRPPLSGQCAQACDVRCPDRLGTDDLRALIETPEQPAALARRPARRWGCAIAAARARRCPRSRRSRAPTAGWWRWWPTCPGAARPWSPRWSRAVSEPRWRSWAAPAATQGRWRPGSRSPAGCRRSRCSTTGGWPRWTCPRACTSRWSILPPPPSRRRGPRTGPRGAGSTWSGATPRSPRRCGWPRPSGSCARPSRRSGSACATGRPGPSGRSSRPSCWATGRSRGTPASPPAPSACSPSSGWWRWGSAACARPPTPSASELEASGRYRDCRRRLDEARAFLSIAPTLDLFASVEPPLAAATG